MPHASRSDDAPDGDAVAGIEASVRRGDPCRWLATRFIADPGARADVLALYAFDLELTRAPKVASNTLIAEIRLTWWREVLEEIYTGGRVRAHPTAQALAAVVRARELPRGPLESLIDARIGVLDRPRLDQSEAEAWAAGVAGAAASLAAQILDPRVDAKAAAPAGCLWGLALLGARGQIEGSDARAWIASRRPAARAAARALGVAAFPAVSHAILAGCRPGILDTPTVGARARLVWASMTGRL